MEESFDDILAAVITGSSSPEQQLLFHQLMQTSDSFRELYQQFQAVFHQPAQIPDFNAETAFERLRARLGK